MQHVTDVDEERLRYLSNDGAIISRPLIPGGQVERHFNFNANCILKCLTGKTPAVTSLKGVWLVSNTLGIFYSRQKLSEN